MKENIISFGKKYLEEEKISYREVVKNEGDLIGYADNSDGTIDERCLSHSTV